jgi:hypothetical protein
MQLEETKKTQGPGWKPKDIDLPVLEEEPVFMGQPLLKTDATGTTLINLPAAFALVAALTLTARDVFRFAEQLDLGADSDVPGEQSLQMVDSRFSDTRALYKLAILKFLQETLPKNWVKEFCIPLPHIATVLLQLYKDREASWQSCKKGKPAKTLFAEKEKAPALVLNAFVLGAFLYRGKEPRVIKDDDRTFLVAFPGYDVRQVPATRSDGIIAAVKYKKNYAHKSMDMGQQQLFKKTLSNHLD